MIAQIKDILSAIQSFFTASAIIAAAFWFLFQHQCGPRLKIEHRVSHRASARDAKQNILGVDVMLSNVGSVSVNLHCGHLRVLNVNPGGVRGGAQMIWPENLETSGGPASKGCLDDMTLEAGESDQVHREIPIGGDVKTIRVHSFFANPNRSDGVGWEFISLYDLDQATGAATQSPQLDRQSSGLAK